MSGTVVSRRWCPGIVVSWYCVRCCCVREMVSWYCCVREMVSGRSCPVLLCPGIVVSGTVVSGCADAVSVSQILHYILHRLHFDSYISGYSEFYRASRLHRKFPFFVYSVGGF